MSLTVLLKCFYIIVSSFSSCTRGLGLNPPVLADVMAYLKFQFEYEEVKLLPPKNGMCFELACGVALFGNSIKDRLAVVSIYKLISGPPFPLSVLNPLYTDLARLLLVNSPPLLTSS